MDDRPPGPWTREQLDWVLSFTGVHASTDADEPGGIAASVAAGEAGIAGDGALAGLADGAAAPIAGESVAPAAEASVRFRPDLQHHLAGPDGWKGGKLHGTHNASNAIAVLEGAGAAKVDALQPGKPGYTVTKTASPGIDRLDYCVFHTKTGKLVTAAKTTYDPALYTDEQMAKLAQQAGEDAFARYLRHPTPNPEPFDTQLGDITMRSYINFDPATDEPLVGNVHPIDPADAILPAGGK